MKNWHKQIKKLTKKGKIRGENYFSFCYAHVTKTVTGHQIRDGQKIESHPPRESLEKTFSIDVNSCIHTRTERNRTIPIVLCLFVVCTEQPKLLFFFARECVERERERELPYVLSDHLLGGFGEVKVDEI